jgi:hypothetical protein
MTYRSMTQCRGGRRQAQAFFLRMMMRWLALCLS